MVKKLNQTDYRACVYWILWFWCINDLIMCITILENIEPLKKYFDLVFKGLYFQEVVKDFVKHRPSMTSHH